MVKLKNDKLKLLLHHAELVSASFIADSESSSERREQVTELNQTVMESERLHQGF